MSSTLLNQPMCALVGTALVEYSFDARVAGGGLAAALAVVLVLSVAASWAASRRAIRQPVRDAPSYE